VSYPQGSVGTAPSPIANDVLQGLCSTPKTLPPYLFYDARGSELYERITELPEYYLTRTERAIFETHADAMLQAVRAHTRGPLQVIELGAGSAKKTELVLAAVLRAQRDCLYVPIDVSASALRAAQANLARALPQVRVRPLVGNHADAFGHLRNVEMPQLVLFIGSSIGNLQDGDAAALFWQLRRALGSDAWLLLGTDLRKDPSELIAAYDDAAGVTAAFNKNLLARINRELGGHFDPATFEHVARWNEQESRIEMHLESSFTQRVAIDALGVSVRFARGETIHTESSIKYDQARVERVLGAGGFRWRESWQDPERRFAVHLASSDAGPLHPLAAGGGLH
jgi:L-histidine Nalpha-methyltransferase